MTREHVVSLAAALPLFLAGVAALAGGPAAADDRAGLAPGVAELDRMSARFAPVEFDLRAEVDHLSHAEQQVLVRLIRAAQVLDSIHLRQVWAGNPALLMELSRDQTPLGKARLHAFLLNKGPWSELDQLAPFLRGPGIPPHPPGANFYPPGATRDEIERWLATLPAAERAQAAGFFTVIRRAPDGHLRAVPYSVEYQGELAQAASLLREAADLSPGPAHARLRAFLLRRAEAFATNDYAPSDVAWMELDGRIEPTIGPYEVYTDEWFNAKAAFEAYIALRDDRETERLQKLGAHLQEIEDHLPIEPGLRNPRLGALAPIRVVNSLFAAGDGNRGVQTAAYNLPNDEKIVQRYGSKRIMLKNVQEAKFNTVLLPIARVALSPEDQRRVSFDAFFGHILMHELMHGLGPHNITVAGKPTTVREQMKENYSALEEAKADISGLYAMHRLIDQGVLDKSMERTLYTTYLASAFRTIRFGVREAHGKGVAMQLNYLIDAGGVRRQPDGTFTVVEGKIRGAVEALTAEVLTIQGHGDAARAAALLGRLGVVRPEVQRVVDRLGGVPVDIEPRYVTAEQLLRQAEAGTRLAATR